MVQFILLSHGALATDMHSGFVSPRTYLDRYWNWNKGSSMSNMVEMVRFRISKLFIMTDQRQFQLWQSSRNSMILSPRSMIGKKKMKKIEKLLVPPWKRSSRSHLRDTIFHLVHMCDLNVCFFSFSD